MTKWFKTFGGLAVAALLATVFIGAAFAQGPVENGDGVRDLNSTRSGQGRGHAFGFVDEDGDGINDRYGTKEFVDQDGDGVCDLCGGVPGENQSQGNGYGRNDHHGRGQGPGLIDKGQDGINNRHGANHEFGGQDGDGACDVHGTAAGEGSGQGYGRGLRANSNDANGTPMSERGGLGREAAGK